jgi:hypothetical protein
LIIVEELENINEIYQVQEEIIEKLRELEKANSTSCAI